MQETWETRVRFLDQEDSLEKEMAPHSSILACRFPWTEESGRLQSIESQTAGHDWSNLAQVSIIQYGVITKKIFFLVCIAVSQVRPLSVFVVFCFGSTARYLSPPTRDQTCVPCNASPGLNNWTAREVRRPLSFFLIFYLFLSFEFLQCCASFR